MKKNFTSLMFVLAGIASLSAQAPANDDCAGAIALPIAADMASCAPTLGTTVGATQSAEANACSATWFDDDVWFSFTTPATLTDSVIVSISFVTGSAVSNVGMSVYDACGGTGLSCFSGASRASRFPATALMPNTTYKIRVWGAGVGAATQGEFNICVYNSALPVGAVAQVSTTKREFFAQMGTPATKSFTISNGGGTAYDIISATVTGAQFTTNLTAGAVGVGASRTVNVTYTPNDMTDDNGSIALVTSAGNFTIDLKGYMYGNGVLYESFQGGIPATFGNIDDDADGNKFRTYSRQTHSGDSCIMSQSWVSDGSATGLPLTPDNYLILPQMTPRVGNNKFTYFTAGQDFDFPDENYDVIISTTDMAPASFSTVAFTEVLTDTLWAARSVDLSAYNGRNIYVAIRHYNVTDKFIIKFDDFRFPDFVLATEKVALAENAVRAFPNPTTGAFNLSWAANLTNVSIEVSDAQGKLVQNLRPQGIQTDINLSNMAAGVYMVRLTSAEGVRTTRINVVK